MEDSSRDGGEMEESYFPFRHRTMMAASVKTGSRLEFDASILLFQTSAHESITGEEFFTYDVTADGQRFLINSNTKQDHTRPIEIVLNWTPGARR
jgi:hypothetical protein